MVAERLTQLLRCGALALFSIALASCGDGSGKDSVSASPEEADAAELRLAFADYFGDPPASASRAQARTIPMAPLAAGNWVVDTGYGDEGWGNDEWQLYQNSMENLFTENGSLVIRARCSTAPSCGKRDGTITSAKITSKERIDIKYGSIRARIKMPSGAGMWPAFWTLGSDIDDRPWPDAGEIDIVEMHYYYSDTRTTHFSTHWAGPRYTDDNRPICASNTSAINDTEEENCYTQSKTFDEPGDVPLTDDFHVYELEWNENTIVGKIDNIIYFTQAIDGATMEEFLKDHYMILNVAVGGTLGGPGGPTMTAADWADPNQTDMLVDWVEVWERVPPTSATLWDNEFISDLPYNRIINTAEFDGGFVKANPKSTAVTPLKNDQVLELTFSTTRSENGGGVTATYAGAIFSFNGSDLSNYDNFVFSLDTSAFPGLKNLTIQFKDANNRVALVRTSDLPSPAISGNWQTYSIPLEYFGGVDMRNIIEVGFFNPVDAVVEVSKDKDHLLAGTLYVDDIRFTRSAECNAASSIKFDQMDYNPATNSAIIEVTDLCAANSMAMVEIENDTNSIFVGVRLDAAGYGESLFEVVSADSVCATGDYSVDYDSLSYLPLSGQLMATYNRSKNARGEAPPAFATAGVNDANAPIAPSPNKSSYFYSTDTNANPLSYFPDSGGSNSFNYSVFGSGSQLEGAFVDDYFSPVFEVQSGNGYGAEVAQIVLINILPAGYPVGEEFLAFKTKGQPNNSIRVEIGVGDGFTQGRDVDLADIDLSTPIAGTGWYDVRVPLQGDGWFVVVEGQLTNPITAFTQLGNYNVIGFVGGGTPPASPYAFLITDIAVGSSSSKVPAECANEVPPGGGTASGGSVPDATIYEADGSEADLSPGYDPFGSGTGIATVADTSYTQALELTIANGYGPSLAQLGLTGLSFTGYDEFLFKVKGLTADNTIRVTAEASGGGSITIDLTSAPSGVTATDLGDGWTQVVIALTAFGDVSSASQVVFQTLDNAYPVGDTFLLTDIGFNNAGGGTASGGSVPDVTIYEADGSEADLSPGYDPFGSGTGIATVADTSYTQALELTIANGYGPSLAQLGLTGLSFTGYDEFLFKVKGLTADNTIRVTAEASGGGSITIDLTSAPSGVTATDLGDGWTQVVIALTAFGDVSSASQVVFQTLDNAYPVGDTFLLTDIGFNNAGGGGGDPGLPLDVNGGFEAGDGDLSDWVVVPNGGTIVSVDTQDSGSVWSVKLAADGSGGSPYISQAGLGAAEVMPGDNVYVSFDMCGTLEGDGGAIKIALLSEKGEGNGSDRATLEEFVGSPPASVWTRYEYTTQASANVTDGVSLQLEAACGAVAGCGVNVYFDNVSIVLGGDPPASQTASGASCAAPPAPGVMLPIDFEDGPYTFGDFGGGQASVEANSQSSGINTSANVGKMLKFTGDGYAGSTLALGGTLTVPANSSSITMNVWSPRAVPVLFKLEGGPPAEVTANHSGGSAWEELTFDFSAIATGDHTGITLFFDPPAVGDAATDPGNWTFYFDDIDFAPAPPPANVTLFADAFAPGWGGFLDANGTVMVVTDSDSTYGEVLELTTSGSTVVGIGSRADIPGADGSTIDTSRFAVLEFDLKLVTAPTSGTTTWRLKVENPGVEIGIDAPVLDTWVRYSIPISDLGTPNALELIMLFADYGANAGAVYRLDNVKLLEEASPPPPEDITLFADALAPGWGGFLDANGTVTVVTDSDSTFGAALELTTSGSTVVGIGSRADIPGADGSTIDTSDFATLEFDLKLVTAPTSGTTNWRFKTENPGQEIGIDAPVLDTWVHYSIPISSLGTPDALDLIMLFPDYGLNAGAVYRLDNVMLLVGDGGGGGGGGGGSAVAINGDFETGDFTGWTLVSAGSSTVPSSIDIDTSNPGTNPDSGSVYTARLQAAGNTGGTQDALLQQVALGAGSVAVGDTINVSFDLYGEIPGPGGVVFVELIYLDSAGNDIGNRDFIDAAAPYFPNNSWTTYTGSKAARINVDGGVTLQIKASCGDVPACTVDAYVDNVTFEIVP